MSRREIERKQRQLLLAGVGFVILLIVGLLSYGWYTSSFQPPRKTIANVGGEAIKLRELVPYTALDSLELGGSLRPEVSLANIFRDRVVAQRAGALGVTVTDEEITRDIVERFEPEPGEGEELPSQLSEEGRTNLDRFLALFKVSEEEYRLWLRGKLYIDELQAHFLESTPETAEQVFVEWIVTTSETAAQEAIDRINEGEEFAAVAADLGQETRISDEQGVVGWVPEGAITELDSRLFDPELELNVLIGPIATSFGSVVLRVTDGPSEQPLDEDMAELLADTLFQDWLDAQVADVGVRDIDLTPDDANWVIGQIL